MAFSYILISPLRDTGKFPICCWHCPVHSSFFVLKIERKEKNYSFAFLPYCVLDTSQRCLKQAVYMKAEGDLWLFLYSEEKKKSYMLTHSSKNHTYTDVKSQLSWLGGTRWKQCSDWKCFIGKPDLKITGLPLGSNMVTCRVAFAWMQVFRHTQPSQKIKPIADPVCVNIYFFLVHSVCWISNVEIFIERKKEKRSQKL